MEAIQIADGVYDVGVIDWNIRDFHGYSTDLGTTYNSFLITDEKTNYRLCQDPWNNRENP